MDWHPIKNNINLYDINYGVTVAVKVMFFMRRQIVFIGKANKPHFIYTVTIDYPSEGHNLPLLLFITV